MSSISMPIFSLKFCCTACLENRGSCQKFYCTISSISVPKLLYDLLENLLYGLLENRANKLRFLLLDFCANCCTASLKIVPKNLPFTVC